MEKSWLAHSLRAVHAVEKGDDDWASYLEAVFTWVPKAVIQKLNKVHMKTNGTTRGALYILAEMFPPPSPSPPPSPPPFLHPLPLIVGAAAHRG
jgi:hypothetical protein